MPFDLVEEAKNLITIRSDADHGTQDLVQHLVPFCEKLGFNITLQLPGNGATGKELNLIAHTAPKDSADLCPDGILLDTHLDTVPAGDVTRMS